MSLPANRDVAVFREWARRADYEATFVYHRTDWPRNAGMFEHARKLSDAGLVFLFQYRSEDGWCYCAKRCHHEHHVTLDKVSRSVEAKPTTAFLVEEGLVTVGRPRKVRQEVSA